MKTLSTLVLAAFSVPVLAQTILQQPPYAYNYGRLAAQNYFVGYLTADSGRHVQMTRFDYSVGLVGSGEFMHRNLMFTCAGDYGSHCYGDIISMQNAGDGVVNGQYVRLEGLGFGPTIARKTAVRAANNVYGNWAEEISLGPNAGAALWVHDDWPRTGEGTKHTTQNVIVVTGNLEVANAVVQWNRCPTCTNDGVFLRVYDEHNQLVFQVDAHGNVKAKSFSLLP